MKRYFLVDKSELDIYHIGEYHYIDLPSGKVALVMVDALKEAPPHWNQLPHVLDQEETMGENAAELSHLGVTNEHTGYKMAKLLGQIHPKFRP